MFPIRIVLLAALCAPLLRAEDTSPAPETPHTKHVGAGQISGQVVKAGNESLTLKIMETVQSGTTRRRINIPSGNGRSRSMTINQPKYTTKEKEVTYTMADNGIVVSAAGKLEKLADLKAGDHVTVLLSKPVGVGSNAHPEAGRVIVGARK